MSSEPATNTTADRSDEWAAMRAKHLHADRPPSSARGVHHFALLSSDVEATIDFYQGVLEFPLTELFENRDYPGQPTSSSMSAMVTLWRSSTFPDLGSRSTKKCSAVSITWPSR